MNNLKTQRTIPKLATLGLLAFLAVFAALGFHNTSVRAADATVSVGSLTSPSNLFTPATANIRVGDKVNFARTAGTHDATSNTGLFAINITSGSPTGSTPVFTTAGTYYYYCTIHYGGATDNASLAANLSPSQMVGRIVVAAPVADTTPPTVSGVAASPNPTNGAGGVALSATVGDNIGVTQARYRIDGGASVAMTVSGGTSATATIPTGALTLGVHTAEVQSQDAAGNVSAWTLLAGGLTVSGTPAGAVQATVTVSGGSLSNVAQAIAFPGVTVTGLDQTVAGTTTPAWQAKDARGTGAGWNVTISSSNFTGSAGSIAVANFKVQLTAVTTVAGNTAPLPSPASYTALSIATPLKLLSAALSTGMGTYDYTPQFQLTVPGSALVGTYAANVTVSVNSGP